MAALVVLVLCFSVMTVVSGSSMQGGLMTFRPRPKNTDGSFTVDFKFKSSFNTGCLNKFNWYCYSGNCGNEVQRQTGTVDSGISPTIWCQTETHLVRRVPNDKPFKLMDSNCCWVYNSNGYASWSLLTVVDLGTRSDTSKPNNSPVTTILPFIRIPRNCPASIPLLAHDPDGDIVQCRYGLHYTGECSTCNPHPQFRLDQKTCILSFSSLLAMGTYVFEIVLEDFPKTDIYLKYYDGTITNKYRSSVRNKREEPKKFQEGYWFESTEYTTDDHSTFPESDYTHTEWYTGSTLDIDVITTRAEILTEAHDTTQEVTVTFETTQEVTGTSDTTLEVIGTSATTLEVTTISDTTQEGTAIFDTTQEVTVTSDTTQEETSVPDKSTESDTETTVFTSEITLQTSFSESPTSTSLTTLETDTDGSSYPTHDPTMDGLSKIPLQFVLEVSGTVPSCVPGQYRPMLLSPTPTNGQILKARVQEPFEVHLLAQATQDSITDFKVSGPANMKKRVIYSSAPGTRSTVLEWTPLPDDTEHHVPLCFVAETNRGYQSEMRCIIIIVLSNKLPNSTLICSENTMTLFIAKKPPTIGLYENHLRLNDPRCLVTSNNTHFIASVGFNTCGTTVEETEDEIVFKNQITSFDKAGDVITRKHQVAIHFNCSFPKETRLSAAFRAGKSVYEFHEGGFGNFTYKFQFYKDNQFTDVLTTYPLNVWLRDLLYMEIQVTAVIPNVQLFVESCRATPHDNPSDPVYYNIIKDGCERDETLVTYPGTNTKYRFSIEAFAFIGNYEEVYMSCTVVLCKIGDPTTRCSRGCVSRFLEEPNPHRRRRSLGSETQQHFISQGPLRLQRQAASSRASDTNPALNVNTLIVAVAVVVVIALVALTMWNYRKRDQEISYEKLPMHEF